jgi:endonuclease/exonuclease/phosphatase family metal-dependent hydrolase
MVCRHVLAVVAALSAALLCSCGCVERGPLGVAQQRAAAPPPLVLATWNINWLNQHDRQGPNPRKEEHYGMLARYARDLDADVIALQEVDGAEAARRVFDPEHYTFHFSSRDNLQRVGFAYRKGLTVKRHPDLVWLARVDSERLRYGVDMSVLDPKTGGSLRLLVVHLKSGCFSSPLDGDEVVGREDPKACQKLAMQVPILEKWIAARVEAKEPFVILGDFNRRLNPADDVWRKLVASNPEAGLSGPTLRAKSRCWGGRYPEFIDHFILDARAARRLDKTSLSQITYSPEDRARAPRELSDHCPMSIDFR